MYKKFLIVASKQDKAGINITTNLSQFRKNPVLGSIQKDARGFDFYLVEKDILHKENLDLNKINSYDFIIFASKHASEKREKTLSVHAPGNWRFADAGGEPGKVCNTSAQFIKQIFIKLKQKRDQHNFKDYKVTLEATHHGPLIEKPCLFIEIGSSENEWVNRRAGFIIAKTIKEVIEEFKPSPYNENVIAIGGTHYCPSFNKIQLDSNLAISHVISKYNFPLTEEMIKQAIEKTEEEVDFALLDWKGLGNKEQRERVVQILDKLYVRYKKTKEINKY